MSIGCATAVQVAEEQPAEEGHLDEHFPYQRSLDAPCRVIFISLCKTVKQIWVSFNSSATYL
jgi:hypothetical protein